MLGELGLKRSKFCNHPEHTLLSIQIFVIQVFHTHPHTINPAGCLIQTVFIFMVFIVHIVLYSMASKKKPTVISPETKDSNIPTLASLQVFLTM